MISSSATSSSSNASSSASSLPSSTTIAQVSRPVMYPYPDIISTCSAYKGRNTCCSNSTLTSITAAKAIVQRNLNEELTSIHESHGLLPFGNVTLIHDLLCAGTLNFTKLQCNAMMNDSAKIRAASDDVSFYGGGCIDSLVQYSVGMLCFSCETNYMKYLDINRAAGSISMKMNTHTSNIVVAKCAPVNEGFRSMWKAFRDMQVVLLE